MTPREKLYHRLGDLSLTSSNIESIAHDEMLVADIVEAILSGEALDSSTGLFFACYVRVDPLCPADIARIIDAGRRRIADSNPSIRASALKVITRFRASVSGYRNLMLAALRDSSAMVRVVAVTTYSTFALPMEIEPLLGFETDETMGEIAMGSLEQRYWLRDEALHAIERTLGTEFSTGYRRRELGSGRCVRWRDWGPVHNWRESHAPHRPSFCSRISSWFRGQTAEV